ncbi:MAG: hypothetical protein AW09_001626 [Candidatus Accumulibacter phosphatis]|uniref:Uncharacterized protein n=1 Tax=Candidatus Accumulibacter phosphatis TaxID=327160 RepID=A0A080LWK0_9PROT|nr:MAG: hypothetical protein AW09_001626 [Candidatus Accumulibacter phosphatis]
MEDEAKLIVVEPCDLGRLQLALIQAEPVLQQGQAPGVEMPFDTYQILLVDHRVLANQLARHSPVLGQDEQACRINVEPACGCQSLQAGRMESRRVRRAILCLWSNQGHCRLAARFRLSRDIAYRLVQQNRQSALLIRLRLPVEGNDGIRMRARSEFADPPTIHENPASRDVFIRIAARAKTAFCHQLGNAYAIRRHPARHFRDGRGGRYAGAGQQPGLCLVRWPAGHTGRGRLVPGHAWQ